MQQVRQSFVIDKLHETALSTVSALFYPLRRIGVENSDICVGFAGFGRS